MTGAVYTYATKAEQPVSALTDELILRAMAARPSGIMTYVIRNILAMEHGFRRLKTSAVLSRLKRLERSGRVRRVRSSYAVMLCWVATHDQFTRWCCPKCGKAGIDSWNKTIFDGTGFGSDYPNPYRIGTDCQECGWPVVVMVAGPYDVPRAISGPINTGPSSELYAYEDDAFERIIAEPGASIALQPSDRRDADWSRGCLAVREQLQ